MATTLPDELHERVKALCAQGDALQEAEQHSRAVSVYEEALALLPEPREQWEATTWILAALVDAYFFQQEWAACAGKWSRTRSS